jgi:hypothetical protein
MPIWIGKVPGESAPFRWLRRFDQDRASSNGTLDGLDDLPGRFEILCERNTGETVTRIIHLRVFRQRRPRIESELNAARIKERDFGRIEWNSRKS